MPALMVLSAAAARATEGVVVADAYVNSTHASVNYGGLSNLYVSGTGTALIRFDLSSLPAGTTASQIGAASLKLYVNRVNTSGLVSVQPITGSWSESTVTYASYSSSLTLGTAVASFTPATAQQFIVIDITSLVQSWVTTPSSNNGLALTTSRRRHRLRFQGERRDQPRGASGRSSGVAKTARTGRRSRSRRGSQQQPEQPAPQGQRVRQAQTAPRELPALRDPQPLA